jgi:hypothetical protein
VVSGSCRAELAEEAPEGRTYLSTSRPWSSNLKMFRRSVGHQILKSGEGLREKQARGIS